MTQPPFLLNDLLPALQQDWAPRFSDLQVTGRVCPYLLLEDPGVFQSAIGAVLGYLEAQGMDAVLIETDYQDDRNACPEVMVQFVFSAKKEGISLLWNLSQREKEAAFSDIMQTLGAKRVGIGFVFDQTPEKLPVTFSCGHASV
jgi:hypothetical protein